MHFSGHARIVSSRVVLNQPVDGIWQSDHFGVLVEIAAAP
jgi:hypothetical protein